MDEESESRQPDERYQPVKHGRRRRRITAISACLAAAALAVPLGLHLTGQGSPRRTPSDDAGKPLGSAAARLQAKQTGKEVEVTAERTATNTTWALPDGQFRTRMHSSAVRAKVGDEWKPVDTSLQPVKGGYAPKAVNTPVRFGSGSGSSSAKGAKAGIETQRASRDAARTGLTTARTFVAGGVQAVTETEPQWSDLVTFSPEGHQLVVQWPGPLPQPVIDGPRALYEGVRPGIDLLMTAQDDGYSHLLIVHTREAAADPILARLDYRLSSPDLTFHLDDTSDSVSARNSAGEEIAGTPTPYMWDSSGKIARTEGDPEPELSDVAKQHAGLSLPGINGAEGARATVATASLAADNTLSVTPDARLLTGPETTYPVFIDPQFKGRKRSWSLLYKSAPDSSFYNGQNFNAGGTNEARVGYEADSGGTSRSAFNFEFDTRAHGATITKATFRALQTYSWGCAARAYHLYQTGWVSSSSTWRNTDNGNFWSQWLNKSESTHGYKSGTCPDAWVGIDMKPAAVNAAKYSWSTLSLGLRAANESDESYWKKFLANGETAPYIDVEYNKPPIEPSLASMWTDPGGGCKTTAPITAVPKRDVTFNATGADGDGVKDLAKVQIKVWRADNGSVVVDTGVKPDPLTGQAWTTVPQDRFTHGATYMWTAWSVDMSEAWSVGGPAGSDGFCTFTVDHLAPPTPAFWSEDFPAPGPDGNEWSKKPYGEKGWIRFLGNGAKAEEIDHYEWSLNSTTFDQKAWPYDGDVAAAYVNPASAGPNVLYLRTVDKAGNTTKQYAKYLFYVSPRPGLDKPGDVTGDGMPDLLAVDGSGNLRTYAGDSKGGTDGSLPGGIADGKPAPKGHWKEVDGKKALIAHSTDWFPGDGLTDLLVRMPDGNLYVYPGDGLGRFDVGRRIEVLLPPGAPDPAALTQIVAVEDVTGDGLPDAFALAGDTFWAFTGYSGATFAEARQLATGWAERDLVGVRDVSGDKVPDLVFRDDSMPDRGLALRKGKPGPNGGVELNSLAYAASAAEGKDHTYATTGWNRAAVPMLLGTPDATGDGIPDIWAVRNDGKQYLYAGKESTLAGPVGDADADGWNTFKSIG
ncbi:DNRLRE domain-containing protein [Streptomyces sp. NPDC089799]|uniref:DNRLRE domain-containing protein n=1 Tax=Streptomyces sp. NPDC089799 TaxID=3155066 RepID=UPI00343F8051